DVLSMCGNGEVGLSNIGPLGKCPVTSLNFFTIKLVNLFSSFLLCIFVLIKKTVSSIIFLSSSYFSGFLTCVRAISILVDFVLLGYLLCNSSNFLNNSSSYEYSSGIGFI